MVQLEVSLPATSQPASLQNKIQQLYKQPSNKLSNKILHKKFSSFFCYIDLTAELPVKPAALSMQ